MTTTAHAPRNGAEVKAHYSELCALHQQLHDSLATRRSAAFKAMATIFALIVFQALRSPHGTLTAPLLATGFIAIIGLIWYSLRQQAKLAREQRLLVLYHRNLARANGTETLEELVRIRFCQQVQQPKPPSARDAWHRRCRRR